MAVSMIRPLLLLLLFGTAFSTFAQNAVRVLTLEDAVSLAQANNRMVKNAQLSVSMSDDQIAEARTYRFPALNLYALGSQLLTPVDFSFQRGAFDSFPASDRYQQPTPGFTHRCGRPSMG
jgi:outer membrane protein TolC